MVVLKCILPIFSQTFQDDIFDLKTVLESKSLKLSNLNIDNETLNEKLTLQVAEFKGLKEKLTEVQGNSRHEVEVKLLEINNLKVPHFLYFKKYVLEPKMRFYQLLIKY